MIVIVIPTFNNLEYLKLCISSINKNSSNKHQLMLHINDGSDGTLNYAKSSNINFTHSNDNIGLCSSINKAVNETNCKYILYAHDDMYFLPNWDKFLINEIELIGHDKFYLSGTMIEPFSGHITYNCGSDINTFDV